MTDPIKRKHVLFLTFPSFGHIIPLLELAKKTSLFHQVTVVVSASMLKELEERELLDAQTPNDFTVLGLDDGIIRNFDTSTPHHGLGGVSAIVQELDPTLRRFLRAMPVGNDGGTSPSVVGASPVDVVVAERFIASIALPGCAERGIPCYLFNATSGATLNAGMDVTEDTPAVPDEPETSSSSRY